ncbi:Nn.00g034110.m01.CDS01 [Neocucurbitaria sp. VM-36]
MSLSMFKRKNRSAHALQSSAQPPDIRRYPPGSTTFKSTGMGSVGEEAPAPAYVDSVITHPNPDAKLNGNGDSAVNEPLVLDFAAMHDGHDLNESKAPLTPDSSRPDFDRSGSWLSEDDIAAPAPPDFTSRGIHVPLRTSSSTPTANKKRLSLQRRLSSGTTSHNMPNMPNMPGTPESQQSRARSASRTPSTAPRSSQSTAPSLQGRSTGPNGMRSSANSVMSYESTAPSVATHCLAPLQEKGMVAEDDRLSPLLEDDPKSFDLVCAPTENERRQFSLETRSDQLFSKEHLEAIFQDTASLLRFTSFLSIARPKSVPVLIYYLDALKALRAVNYANAVAEALEPINGLDFTETPARPTVNAVLEEKANRAFAVLVQDDLPAFITHIFIQTVSVSISKRVTGNLPPLLREASEGLAEVFCLTDPSRTDNPIIFASEEFHRTTQYGVSYAIGRNCRFLQGPKTNRSSVARFKAAVQAGNEHSEVFLNYRRDGSPFMNLLMMAPLLDSRGNLRYFIGAQIDVSGLVKDSTDLDAFQRMLDQQEGVEKPNEQKDEFQELSEMFNHSELDTVRKFGGNMHREHLEEQDDGHGGGKPRLLIQDQSTFDVDKPEKPAPKPEGRLSGPYKHYLLVRPAPSLRILFTSPSLRVPGILQSHFLDRIGGSNRVRESLADALSDATRGVTAKIRWLSHAVQNLENSSEEGRPRWIHCTPLLGQSGAVGVWMIVLVDEKEHAQPVRRFRQAPPVSNDIRGKQQQMPWDLYSRPNQNSSRRPSFDDDIDSTYSPTQASMPYPNSHGLARHMALDALRQPPGPGRARSPMMHDQRAMRSASSSIKDYVNGREASVDSFAIL